MANLRPTFLVPALLVLAAFAPGCLPSDAEIEGEMASRRREAYEEWKRSRERGDTSSAKLNGPLTIEDAVKLALQYNKALQQTIQDQEVTRGARISAYGVILPSATISGGANRYEHLAGNNDLHSYSLGLRVDQPIAQGGQYPARLRTARLNTALTNERIRAQIQQLIAEVATKYYDVLLARELLDTNRVAVESAEAQLRAVTERRRQGTATDYEVLRAQVDVATYRAQMLSQENMINTNRVALLKLMGVSQDSEITFADKLRFLPMRPVFERAVEIASGLRPDLRIAELDARVAGEAVRMAESAWWPSLGASFAQNWGDDGGGSAWSRNRWSAGLNAGWTFDVANHGDLVSERARETKARIAVLDQQETTLQEIRQQMNTLANAEEVVKALEVNQEAAREALRLAEIGYQAGARTELDVTDARKALTDVMAQYYQALADHTKARLNLQLAMGVLGPARLHADGAMPRGSSVPVANIEEFAAPDSEAGSLPPITFDDLNSPVVSEVWTGSDASAAPVAASPVAAVSSQAWSNVEPLPAPVPAAQAVPARAAETAPLVAAAPVPARTGLALPPPPQAAPAFSEEIVRTSETSVSAPAPQPASAAQPAPLFKVTVREG
ncbi:MAG: TolC family protein [Planctomycetota bacterium]|jgi:outer membrane protein TolC|nr:TolC family protein [Planctomycetota bacterium]